MGILSQQLGISAKATTNDIGINPEARSLTAPSGFYADGGKYPDNRPVWDYNALVKEADDPEIETYFTDGIRPSSTAGKLG